jgi:hypothetical protein
VWGGFGTPMRESRSQRSRPVHAGREGVAARGRGSGSAARWFDNRLPTGCGAAVDGVGRLSLCTVPALLRTQAHAHAAAQPASSLRSAIPSAESAPARQQAQPLAAHRRARLGACEGHVGCGGAHPAPLRDGSCPVSPASGRRRVRRAPIAGSAAPVVRRPRDGRACVLPPRERRAHDAPAHGQPRHRSVAVARGVTRAAAGARGAGKGRRGRAYTTGIRGRLDSCPYVAARGSRPAWCTGVPPLIGP